jgi:hypothetical protein
MMSINLRRYPLSDYELFLFNFYEFDLKKIDLTYDLLKLCEKEGITKVCIYTCHHTIPYSTSWGNDNNSIITYPQNIRIGRWPAIWDIVDKLGIKNGAGNSDQHQVKLNILIKGVYIFDNRYWKQIISYYILK